MQRSRGISLVVGGALLLTVLVSGTAMAEGDGTPSLRAQTDWNSVWPTDWPAGTDITVVVDTDRNFDLGDTSTYLRSGTATADGEGQVTVSFEGTGLEMKPGHYVTAQGGMTTKQLQIPELTVFADTETGDVFGTFGIAELVGDIGVYAHPSSGEEVFRYLAVTTQWSTNLAVAPTHEYDTGHLWVQSSGQHPVLPQRPRDERSDGSVPATSPRQLGVRRPASGSPVALEMTACEENRNISTTITSAGTTNSTASTKTAVRASQIRKSRKGSSTK